MESNSAPGGGFDLRRKKSAHRSRSFSFLMVASGLFSFLTEPPKSSRRHQKLEKTKLPDPWAHRAEVFFLVFSRFFCGKR